MFSQAHAKIQISDVPQDFNWENASFFDVDLLSLWPLRKFRSIRNLAVLYLSEFCLWSDKYSYVSSRMQREQFTCQMRNK